MSRLFGIFGHPYADLSGLVDTSCFPELDEEIVCGLPLVEPSYTGGSLKWMGVTAPWVEDDGYVDYMQVIERFSPEELARFVSYGEPPEGFDAHRKYRFGDETEHPLSFRQMLYLKYRYGVYFPWKVYYEMIPNLYWDEKSSSEGKSFTRQARMFFPRTVAFVQGLPFREIGRCNIMGLEPNDHGTVHRDGDPAVKTEVDHFITFCPGGDKRLFLWCEETHTEFPIDRRAYWFNDSDYHGVEKAPRFRYSVRVDGVFEEDFVEKIRSSC